MIYEFEGRKPKIDKTAYVSPEATVIGDVRIGKSVWIGPGAVIRGDYGTIEIGDKSCVEDNCVCHARNGQKCVVGKNVTVGHAAIIHTCTVKDNAVIGMGAIISDWAEVGEWAIVGEGAVVKRSQKIPADKIAVGVPAEIAGDVTQERKKEVLAYKALYIDLAKKYPKRLKQL
ncbi:MAG: gamma carbonic anhydrase family protein [Candidatus Thermoplasmatota archaeon]|nr:gamma carbonic anhydrase family protein [Candidatus Thermoplasmatota archaeon]